MMGWIMIAAIVIGVGKHSNEFDMQVFAFFFSFQLDATITKQKKPSFACEHY